MSLTLISVPPGWILDGDLIADDFGAICDGSYSVSRDHTPGSVPVYGPCPVGDLRSSSAPIPVVIAIGPIDNQIRTPHGPLHPVARTGLRPLIDGISSCLPFPTNYHLLIPISQDAFKANQTDRVSEVKVVLKADGRVKSLLENRDVYWVFYGDTNQWMALRILVRNHVQGIVVFATNGINQWEIDPHCKSESFKTMDD